MVALPAAALMQQVFHQYISYNQIVPRIATREQDDCYQLKYTNSDLEYNQLFLYSYK
jgi:hypothetical protein